MLPTRLPRLEAVNQYRPYFRRVRIDLPVNRLSIYWRMKRIWWCCVKKTRKRRAVRKMEAPGPSCRRILPSAAKIRGSYHDRGQERKKPATQFLSVLIAGYDGVGTRGGPQARALSRGPDGLRGLTAAPRSNRCSPCDRRQTVACCAKSLTQGNRRVELLAALQHAEANRQQLAHRGDHDLLSLKPPLGFEPIDQSRDGRIVPHRRQGGHV